MYSDENKKVAGDDGSVAGELLNDIPDLEQKCRAVDKAIKDGYFTPSEALAAYKVSEVEYFPYLILKNNRKFKRAKKQDQFFGSMSAIFLIFDSSFSTFDAPAQKAIIRLKKELAQNNSPIKKVFEKIS
jgi:hypothetical protein